MYAKVQVEIQLLGCASACRERFFGKIAPNHRRSVGFEEVIVSLLFLWRPLLYVVPFRSSLALGRFVGRTILFCVYFTSKRSYVVGKGEKNGR